MRRNSRNKNKREKIQEQKQFNKTIKILGSIILFLILVLALIFSFDFFTPKDIAEQQISSVEHKENEEEQQEEKQEDTTFTLTAIGDIMCHNTQY